MKFADKYEILEMVTSGRVSTFLARERASQEAVVVYTFECAGTGAGELSTASIISRFCALAPNPPGIIGIHHHQDAGAGGVEGVGGRLPVFRQAGRVADRGGNASSEAGERSGWG